MVNGWCRTKVLRNGGSSNPESRQGSKYVDLDLSDNDDQWWQATAMPHHHVLAFHFITQMRVMLIHSIHPTQTHDALPPCANQHSSRRRGIVSSRRRRTIGTTCPWERHVRSEHLSLPEAGPDASSVRHQVKWKEKIIMYCTVHESIAWSEQTKALFLPVLQQRLIGKLQ